MILLVLCDISLAVELLGLDIQSVSLTIKHANYKGYLFAQLCFALSFCSFLMLLFYDSFVCVCAGAVCKEDPCGFLH